jgi:hypothetical protein
VRRNGALANASLDRRPRRPRHRGLAFALLRAPLLYRARRVARDVQAQLLYLGVEAVQVDVQYDLWAAREGFEL